MILVLMDEHCNERIDNHVKKSKYCDMMNNASRPLVHFARAWEMFPSK